MKTNEQTAQLIAEAMAPALSWTGAVPSKEIVDWDTQQRNHIVNAQSEYIKRILDERDVAEVHTFDEKIPEDGATILALNDSCDWVQCKYYSKEKMVCSDWRGFVSQENYTHWRHMPANPRKDGES